MSQVPVLYFHNGVEDFPHGAGASLVGWYVYTGANFPPEPAGPYATQAEACPKEK